MAAAEILSFTLCIFIAGANGTELDCSFDVHLMPNEPYRWIEQGTKLRNTSGFIDYYQRDIFINTDANLFRDQWGMNTFEHETAHARGYLEWAAAGYRGVCPCHFHR